MLSALTFVAVPAQSAHTLGVNDGRFDNITKPFAFSPTTLYGDDPTSVSGGILLGGGFSQRDVQNIAEELWDLSYQLWFASRDELNDKTGWFSMGRTQMQDPANQDSWKCQDPCWVAATQQKAPAPPSSMSVGAAFALLAAQQNSQVTDVSPAGLRKLFQLDDSTPISCDSVSKASDGTKYPETLNGSCSATPKVTFAFGKVKVAWSTKTSHGLWHSDKGKKTSRLWPNPIADFSLANLSYTPPKSSDGGGDGGGDGGDGK